MLRVEPKPEHDLKTTNQTFYGAGVPKSAGLTLEGFDRAAGTVQGSHFAELRANKAKPNVVTAEAYRHNTEWHQNDTKIQRTWINMDDPGLKCRAYAPNNSELPDKDNFNSLPLGQGEYFRNPIQ